LLLSDSITAELEDDLGEPVTVEEFEPERGLTEKIQVSASHVAYAFGAGVASVIGGDRLPRFELQGTGPKARSTAGGRLRGRRPRWVRNDTTGESTGGDQRGCDDRRSDGPEDDDAADSRERLPPR